MAYVTRCPYCGAVWLLPDKETAEAAPVKCSKCLKCFDATRDLLSVPDALFPQSQALAQKAAPKQLVPTAEEKRIPDGQTPTEHPAIQAPVLSAVTQEKTTPAEQAHPAKDIAPTAPSKQAQKQLEKLSILMSDFSGRTEPTVGIPSRQDPKLQENGKVPETEDKTLDPAIPQTVGTAPKKKKNTWGGPVLIGVLSVVILAVSGIVFNQSLLQKFPSSKPLFDSVCTRITCPGFFLKNIEAFAVTKAQLTSSGTPGNYTLEVTILNGSTIAQAVPHLSLQLVDDNDAEITRQILKPADFLADPSVKSLGAGRSLTVHINMRTNATPSRCIATPLYP